METARAWLGLGAIFNPRSLRSKVALHRRNPECKTVVSTPLFSCALAVFMSVLFLDMSYTESVLHTPLEYALSDMVEIRDHILYQRLLCCKYPHLPASSQSAILQAVIIMDKSKTFLTVGERHQALAPCQAI
jgi:hypothetical protein